MLDKFQMLYMPNIEITKETLKNNKKNIYFLVDDYGTNYYIQYKVSLKSFSSGNVKVIKFTQLDFTCYRCSHICKLSTCTYIYNSIKRRLQNTFTLLNYIFITDVAKYLFLMYYDVAFG